MGLAAEGSVVEQMLGPTLTIGDDKDYFSRISQHATAKTRFSSGAGGGNNNND